MPVARTILVLVALALGVGVLVWIEHKPAPATAAGPGLRPARDPLRIGLVPERDIFEQRRRYAFVADHLSNTLGRPVQLVTVRSYGDVLDEFRDNRIDGAFLGSLITVLAVDQLDTTLIARPQDASGSSTYRGVIFVSETSSIRTIDDLAGKSIAMVPTTTASCLFPVSELTRRGAFNSDLKPRTMFVGTHDDAILEVYDGRADAGAVKESRLDEFEKTHPRFRRLATSESVPENTLVMRKQMPVEQVEAIRKALLAMHETEAGRAVLKSFGAQRFVPSEWADYMPVYDMIEPLGKSWQHVDALHAPPRRSGTTSSR